MIAFFMNETNAKIKIRIITFYVDNFNKQLFPNRVSLSY